MSPNTSTITGSYKSRRRHGGHIVIPPILNPTYKIIITGSDGVNYTVADTYTEADADNYFISGDLITDATDKLSAFRLRITNAGGRFLNKFKRGDILRAYGGLGTPPLTLGLYGRIDDVRYGCDITDGFFIDIDGRDYPELVDKTITGLQADARGDEALCNIFYNFYSDIKLKFWNGSAWAVATYDSDTGDVTWSPAASNFPTRLINTSYQHKKGLTITSEILKKLGMESYLEYDEGETQWYMKTFISESINTGLGIAYGVNLVSIGEYGTDNSDVYNRIRVYGTKESDNILLLKTEENTGSQSDLWIKEKIINAPDLLLMSDVQARADLELSEGLVTTPHGRLSATNIISLKPGEMIECDVPYCNISGLHKASRITHNLGKTIITTVEVTKEIKKLSIIFVEKDNPDDLFFDLTNLNLMKDSYTVYFADDENKMIHDNTEEIDGRLELSSGQTAGTATSVVYVIDYVATECELRRFDNSLIGNDRYYVSADGEHWEEYTAAEGKTHIFKNPGTRIQFKIIMARALATDPSPAYNSVCMLVK